MKQEKKTDPSRKQDDERKKKEFVEAAGWGWGEGEEGGVLVDGISFTNYGPCASEGTQTTGCRCANLKRRRKIQDDWVDKRRGGEGRGGEKRNEKREYRFCSAVWHVML